MTPLRIALVTEFYYPHLGGVTEHVQNLAEQFISQGHSVVVITARMGGGHVDAPFVRRIGRSAVIFSNGSFARLTVGWGLRAQIERILREERIDVVHVHGGLAPTLGLVAPSAADRLGIPVVATYHSWFPSSPLYRLLRAPLQRRLDRIAANIAVSEPVVEALSRYFRADWEIIPNGVRVDLFQPAASSNGGAPAANGNGSRHGAAGNGLAGNGLAGNGAHHHRTPRLLFLGRLDPRNGLDTVLSAMPGILRHYPDAQLVVVGEGPLGPHYRRLARGFNGAVTFVGQIYEERPAYYASADVYLCPTDKASFGITLLEAMACGTPIIASDIVGFRELVDGGAESLLVPTRDPGAWSQATVQLIADTRRRVEMGEAGRRKAERFAWPLVAARVLRVYERVLK